MSADRQSPLVVTIDGPAASGKSSTAQTVAARLQMRHLDSGMIYRSVTAARLRGGDAPDLWTEQSVIDAAARVSLAPGATSFLPRIDGEDCESEIRGEAVTGTVSLVAKMPHVRAWVNALVRATAAAHEIVVDGRDMGTAVFPDARLKVWLVAHPEERARRRVLQRSGRAPTPSELTTEAAELEARDRKDREQTQPAADAVWIDTTGIAQEEQVGRIVVLAEAVR
ncbi:MAG: (d)CMP kinase [Gemmatimonadaceae bacterium]|nr:(d)CMP kinase [Gemmatimonadaceae bacterium]